MIVYLADIKYYVNNLLTFSYYLFFNQ